MKNIIDCENPRLCLQRKISTAKTQTPSLSLSSDHKSQHIIGYKRIISDTHRQQCLIQLTNSIMDHDGGLDLDGKLELNENTT